MPEPITELPQTTLRPIELGVTPIFLKQPMKIDGNTVEAIILKGGIRPEKGLESAILVVNEPDPRNPTVHKQKELIVNDPHDIVTIDWKNVEGIKYRDEQDVEQFIAKNDLTLDPPGEEEKKVQEPPLVDVPGEPLPPSPLVELEKRSKISVIGVQAKERRVQDLAADAMERNRDIWKSMFHEFFGEKHRQYFDKMLDAAQTPFARESILIAEKKAHERYDTELKNMSDIRRPGRKLWEWIKDHTFGMTRVQEYAIEELSILQDKALTNESAVFEQEKQAFAKRFELEFDNADSVVRKNLGEKLAILDPAHAEHALIIDGIKTIIKEFRDGKISDDAGLEAKLEEFYENTLKPTHPELFADAETYASSLKVVAREMRMRKVHGEGLANLDAELSAMEVRLGIGTMGEATEFTPTETRKWVKKINDTLATMQKKDIVHQVIFNDATIATAVSAVLALKVLPQMGVSSALRWFGGAFAGGGVAAALGARREYGRRQIELRRMWAQREAGITTPDNAKRRKWFDRFILKPRSADELVSAIRSPLYEADGKTVKPAMEEEDLYRVVANIADARARKEISGREKNRFGLIEIGAVGGQELKRTMLDQTLLTAQKDLQTYAQNHHADAAVQNMFGTRDVETYLATLTSVQRQVLEHGRTAIDAIADPNTKLGLDPLSAYLPEVDVVRRRFGLIGKEFTRGKTSGLNEVLLEFNKQAKREAIRQGIKSGVVGVGIGMLANEVALDIAFWRQTGHFEMVGAVSKIPEIFGFHPEANAVLSPAIGGMEFWKGNATTQLGDNLTVGGDGNLDFTDKAGNVRHDIMTDFEKHSIYDKNGILHIDREGMDMLEKQGLLSGITHEEFTPSALSGATDTITVGDKLITLPHELHFVADPSNPNMKNLVMTLKDAGGVTKELLVGEHIPLPNNGVYDSSVMRALDEHKDFFSVAKGPDIIQVTPNQPSIPLLDQIVWKDAVGNFHTSHLTLPQGLQLESSGSDTFSLIRTDGSHVIDGIHFDDKGMITNLHTLKLPQGIEIKELGLDTFTQVEKTGTDLSDMREIHTLTDKDWTNEGFWGWTQRHVQSQTFENRLAAINAVKNAARGYELHYVGPDGKDLVPGSGKEAVFFDAVQGIPAREVPYHETFISRLTGGYELHFEALPNNSVLRLPNVLFSDDSMAKIGHLSDESVRMFQAELASHPEMTPMDIMKHIYDTDRIHGIGLKIGYFGTERDIPTKDELDALMAYLGGAGTKETAVSLHNFEIIEKTMQATQEVTFTPHTLVANVFTVAELPEGFIPVLPPILPYRPIEPIEPYGRSPIFDIFETPGYYGIERFDTKTWKTIRSSRLIENPHAVLDMQTEIRSYFDKEDSSYMNEVDDLEKQIGKPLKSDIRAIVCMPVAAHAESENIYHTLELYSKQNVDWNKAEITLFVNWPDDADKTLVAKTCDEIARFTTEHPDIPISVMKKEFNKEDVLYGKIVKTLNDAVLRRIQNAKIDHDVMLLTNDADCLGISTSYLSHAVELSENDKDGFLGKMDWGSMIYPKYPGFHVTMKFQQYMDYLYATSDIARRIVPSSGANFAVKASMFAAVGGYNEKIGAGADTELGKKILAARLGDAPSFRSEKEYPMAYDEDLWLETNPRQALEYYRDGKPIIGMWQDFDAGGYKISTISTDQAETLETDWDAIQERIEFQITRMITEWIGFDKRIYYEKPLDWLFGKDGWNLTEVDITKDGLTAKQKRIKLTDTGSTAIRQKLTEFRDTRAWETRYADGKGVM